MKKILYIGLTVAISTLSLSSCKKDGDNTITPCEGGNLCFTLDGQDLVFNAELEQMDPNKYRIATTGPVSGSDWQRVELYIYWNGTTGDYPFTYTADQGTANMLYFGNEGGNPFQYFSEDDGGILKLVSTTDGKWTGTFSGNMSKQGVSGTLFSLQNGKFVDVAE